MIKIQEQENCYLHSESDKNKQKATVDQIKVKRWEKWTVQENIQYLKFLENHPNLFTDIFTKRSSRVFNKLSKFIQKKNPEQCRTHHQKMERKCKGNVPVIIQLVRNNILKSLKRRANYNDKAAMARLAYFNLTKKFSRQQKIDGFQRILNYHKLSKVRIKQNNIIVKISMNAVQSW